MTAPNASPTARRLAERDIAYDPWADVRTSWPAVRVVLEPMAGSLLGWLRYPVIALRADSSPAQLRCTLTHELVHLERGVLDCGPWAAREERRVHREAARRLVTIADLARAVRAANGSHDLPGLARTLDVDRETLVVRLQDLTAAERRLITRRTSDLWSVA